MGHIVFAWELGRNLGHLLRFLPIATQLKARGHRVSFCARDLSRAAPILDPLGFPYYQSPVWLPAGAGLPPPVSYADIMLHNGFLQPETLGGPVRAWRRLFELLQPDLLVLDHAPTALVAARGMDVPVALIGSGFLIPPRLDPLPPFRRPAGPRPPPVKQVNQRVLGSINHLLQADGQPALGRLSDLFEVDETFLCTVAELDHYAQRPKTRYWGPLYSIDTGARPRWPNSGQQGKRVFAYLYPETDGFRPLMQALQGLPVDALVHAPGLSPADSRALQGPRLQFSSAPLRMRDVLQQADLVISHGSFGTISAALMAGRPVLALPTQTEQAIISRRVEKQGLGLVIGKQQRNPNFKKILGQLLEDDSFTRLAGELRDRYAGQTLEDRVEAISERCEELLA